MKTFIIGAEAEANVVAKNWLIAGTSLGVKPCASAVAPLGVAETTVSAGDLVGVIKQGLFKAVAVTGTYAFGDIVELDSSGQKLVAGTTAPVGTIAEDLVLSADGEILVYVNVA